MRVHVCTSAHVSCVCVCIHCVHKFVCSVYMCVLKQLIRACACGVPSADSVGREGRCTRWMWCLNGDACYVCMLV